MSREAKRPALRLLSFPQPTQHVPANDTSVAAAVSAINPIVGNLAQLYVHSPLAFAIVERFVSRLVQDQDKAGVR